VKLTKIATDPITGNEIPANTTDVSSLVVVGASTDGGRTFPITFNNPTGAFTKSLDDGVYRLTLDRTKVTNGGIQMAADYLSPKFHRMFGDSTGDAAVGALDYAAFKAAFSKSFGEAGYVEFFDVQGSAADGTINQLDYANFKNRFGKAFNYV